MSSNPAPAGLGMGFNVMSFDMQLMKGQVFFHS